MGLVDVETTVGQPQDLLEFYLITALISVNTFELSSFIRDIFLFFGKLICYVFNMTSYHMVSYFSLFYMIIVLIFFIACSNALAYHITD